jgi:hypothetical protein
MLPLVLSREHEGGEIFGSKTSAMIPLVRLLYRSMVDPEENKNNNLQI